MKKIFSLMITIALLLVMLPSGVITSYSADDDSNPFNPYDNERKILLAQATKPYTKSTETQRKRVEALNRLEEKDETLQNYIVRFNPSITYIEIEQLISSYSYELIGGSEQKLFLVTAQSQAELETAFYGKYKYIEPDGLSSVAALTNDDYYSEQWALDATKVTDAWVVTKGSSNVTVAVIDSGIDRSHEDFNFGNILNGIDYYSGYGTADWDSCGHGTNVTGVIAAATNNSRGIAGVCWNVKILPLLVFDTEGYTTTSDLCDAIYDAADMGADIINLSLGSTEDESVEEDAISYAASKGCIIVAAAGNDGTDDYEYPASYDGVISAASVDSELETSDFSNYNNRVDVSAPGENILTTSDASIDGYDYIYVDGTSLSAPYVTGIAALARAVDDTIDTYEFHDILKYTSADQGIVGYDNIYGYGVIDAESILGYLTATKRNNNYVYSEINSGTAVKIINYIGAGGNVSVPGIINGFPVTKIGNYAFEDCDSLLSVSIPPSVTEIGFDCFQYSSNLTKATIGAGITAIPDSMFYGCNKLSCVILPPKLQTIEKWAFGECNAFTSFTVPDTVTYIGRFAFIGSMGLSSVTIGSGVSFIDDSAFYGCEKLAKATFRGDAPELYIDEDYGCEVFDDCASSFTVYYSEGKLGFTNPWYGYTTSVIPSATLPATPQNLKANSVSYNSIKLGWTAVSGASGYVVYRYNPSAKAYERVTVTASTSFTDTGRTTGREYFYKVRAYRTVAGKNIYGNPSAAVKGKAIPSVPSNFKAVRYSSTSIKLTWSPVAGASGYVLYKYNASTKTWGRLKVLSASAASYINTGLSKGLTYYYKIRVYRTVSGVNVYGNPSTAVSAKTY